MRRVLISIVSLILVCGLASPAVMADGLYPQKAIPSSPEEIARAHQKELRVQERLQILEARGEIPSSKVLSTTGYSKQPDGNTCGPTSAHNLLLNWGEDVSIDHLKTDLLFDGSQTPFGDHWPATLNDHSNSSYYDITEGPSQNTLWSAFVNDTIDECPFILDTHMSASTGWLEGYTDGQARWHYVTGNGYSNYYSGTKRGWYFDQYDHEKVLTYGEHYRTLAQWQSLCAERGIVW